MKEKVFSRQNSIASHIYTNVETLLRNPRTPGGFNQASLPQSQRQSYSQFLKDAIIKRNKAPFEQTAGYFAGRDKGE